MLQTDTIDFVAYSPASAALCASGAVAALAQKYFAAGYQLTQGLAYPFNAPQNRLSTPAAIEQALHKACDFSQRRRVLNFWQPPFAFSLRLAQPVPELLEWTLYTEMDTLLGGDNTLGEPNAAALVQVIGLALTTWPTVYGCLFAMQSPPSPAQVQTLAVTTLYPVNYFSRPWLERFGADKVAATPAWRNAPIGTGALVIPSLKAIYADDPVAMQRAQQYLFGTTNPAWAEEA